MATLIAVQLRMAAALVVAAATLSFPQPQVLFSVQEGSDGLAIEPIAMVTKTPGPCRGCWTLTFAEAPLDDESGPQNPGARFAARYYRRDRTYRVLAGGADIGVAKVTKETDLGCISMAASVDITPALPETDWSGPRALAVGSLRIPPRQAVRREPDPAEEQAIWTLADHAFRAKGVPEVLLAGMTAWNLVSVDLNHDGKLDVVGSFEVPDEKARITHRLFLIALRDAAGGYCTEYVWYFRFADENEVRTDTMRLVDTIDLDEDGTDEVVVCHTYYESQDYEILKRGPGGKWKSVYRGGGSGC